MIVEGLSLPRYDADPLMGETPPFGHQVTARETIADHEEFYLALTAPTGSGKTSAWAVPAFAGDRLGVVLALYPTNALARDQYATLGRLRDELRPDKAVEYLDAEQLGILRDQSEFGQTKGEEFQKTIERVKRRGGVIVTNPDLFVYALKGFFANQYLPSVLVNSISTVVFDEFHLFGLKQTDLLLFLLHEIALSGSARLRRCIFLSATPNERALQTIRDVIGGNLVVAGPQCERPVRDMAAVMPEVDLALVRGTRFGAGEAIVADLEAFEAFRDGRRTAIILDSPAEVWMVADALRERTGLAICEMSGFRKGSMDEPFDVLVGNKAVEVGIDFKGPTAIQRLVFSAHNASEFLQRFGRLRNPDPAERYRAICYAPRETVDHFAPMARVTRAALEDGLRRTMRDPRAAESFRWRYGYLEAWEHVYRTVTGIGAREARAMANGARAPLTGGVPTDRQSEVLSRGLRLIYAHYFRDTGLSPDQMLTHPDIEIRPLDDLDARDPRDSRLLDVIDELVSFRGERMSLAFVDRADGRSGTYDLFFLLRWTDFELVSEARFRRELPEERQSWARDISGRVVGYVILHGRLDQPRRTGLGGGGLVHEPRKLDRERLPRRIHGVRPVARSQEPSGADPDLGLIEQEVQSRGVFCRYFPFDTRRTKALYDLDDYLPLVPYKDGSLALGLDALYADAAAAERRAGG